MPNCPITEEKVTSEAGKELKVGDATNTSSFMTASSKVSQIIQPERFSSLNRLIRVTALVLKFIRKVKRGMETQPDLNMQEIIAAEVVTVDNSLRQVRLKRPIQKLYPLEVNARDEDPVSVVGPSVHPGSRNIQVVRDEDFPAVTIAS